MHFMIGLFFLVAAIALWPRITFAVLGVGVALTTFTIIAIAVQHVG